MNGSYTKLMSAIGARGSNGAGAPGMSKSWLARLSKGRSDDAVLGEETAPQVVAVAADQGVVEIE